jgi:hypothetical protein
MTNSEKPNNHSKLGILLKEIEFFAKHPIAAARTRLRQNFVGLDMAGPPSGVAIEIFASMPVDQAALTMFPELRQVRRKNTGGVQAEDYSEWALKNMEDGGKSKSAPYHRNV